MMDYISIANSKSYKKEGVPDHFGNALILLFIKNLYLFFIFLQRICRYSDLYISRPDEVQQTGIVIG